MGFSCEIPVFDLVQTLANAADLMCPAVANHHRRVAYICQRLAHELQLPQKEIQDLVVAASLHDLGAFSVAERVELLEFEVEAVQHHAEFGYIFFKAFEPFAEVAQIIRYHHTRWDDGAGAEVAGEKVNMAGHLLHLADRIDVLAVNCANILAESRAVVEQIAAQAGAMFVPEFVHAFKEVARFEYFWLDLRSPALSDILKRSLAAETLNLNSAQMIDLASLLAHLVDFKSYFTSTHTAGVAHSAAALARVLGLSPDRQQKVLLAGYLHDIGKLAVPREILDKPAMLDADEFGVIKSHAYFTRQILETISGIEDITDWAASHHERLDGSGYPYHLQDMPLESRIVAVADVFTAIAEDRPYRKGMSPTDIARLLEDFADTHHLDPLVVNILLTHQDEVDEARRNAQVSAKAEYELMLEQAQALDA